MNWLVIDRMIIDALKEDVPEEDITTISIVSEESRSMVDLIAKEDGVLAGLEVFRRVFTILGGVEITFLKKDGDSVKNKELIGTLEGSTRNLLTGERVALNYLQRTCGIATLTHEFVKRLEGCKAQLVDTRKTTPNMRVLEKYAVRVGGAANHRYNLSDGILLKDNHISAAGGIKNAVEMARKRTSFVRKIEVEVETLEMVQEALDAKADIIMLDNMDAETMKQAVAIIAGRAAIEASGNVNLNTIREIGETGVDYISTGAITHSAKILDLSMKNLRNI